MKRILFIFFVALGSLGVVNGQNFWNALKGPSGGNINDIVAPTGAMLAATNNGAYRSTDSGVTWAKMTLGSDNIFTDFDIDPSSSGNKVYAATGNGARIYVSTDAGLTWAQVSATGIISAVNKIKVAPNGTIFMTDTGLRLLTSTNSGSSFSNTSLGPGLIVNDLDVDNSSKLIISTSSQGLKVTTDGSTFNAPPTGTITPSSNVLSTTVNSAGVIFSLTSTGPSKSIDHGATFVSIKNNLTDPSFAGILELDPSGNIYYASTYSSKVFTSTAASGGAAWSVGVAMPPYAFILPSALFSSTTNWYLGYIPLGLFKTTTAGANWAQSSAGISGLPATNKLFITPANKFLLMGWSTGTGYFSSYDDGTTWTLNASAATNRNLIGFTKLADNSILGYGNGVIRSTDEVNWVLQSAQTLSQLVTADGTNLFSFSGTNLLKSIDKGVTWTSSSLSGPSSINKIQVDGANNLYFSTPTQVFKANTGSTTAAALAALTATSIQDMQVVGSNIYVIGNGLLYTSTDGGITFSTKVAKASASALWVFDSQNMFLRTTSNDFYISNDGGGTWNDNPLLDPLASATDAVVSPSTYLYVATANSITHKSAKVILPPAAPTALSVIGSSNNQVELLWNDNAVNEDDYIIEISVGDNQHYTAALATPNTGPVTVPFLKYNFSYGGLSSNTLYFFRVKAINSIANSAYSNEVSVTTLNQCTSTIPSNRSWTATAVADPGSTPAAGGPFTSHTVNIIPVVNTTNQFTVSDLDLGVDPVWGHDANPFLENCGSTEILDYNFENNLNGTWDGTTLILHWQDLFNGASIFQGTTTLTLNASDPTPAPPLLNTYNYSGTQVLLNWNSIQFAQNYDIKRATVSGGPYTTVATVSFPTVTYIDNSLINGTKYYYVVTSKNTWGTSASSPESGIQVQNGLFTPVQNSIQLNFENQQGISWGDLDGDGDEDIASPSFTNSAGLSVPPVFYENMGDGVTFNRRDLSVLTDENTAVSRGINLFDYNNDGKLDIYITRSATNIADLLLINNGAWNFTKQLIAETVPTNSVNAFRTAAAADYDNDGKTDIFVGNNSDTDPPTIRGQLFKNTGNSTYSEILTGSLVTDLNDAINASWADYDNDGDQDLFITNYDSWLDQPNKLYKNNGDGTFTRVTGLVFDTDLFFLSRTVSWGDIDNDGDLDLYVGSQNTGGAAYDRLYQNNGNGTFTSLTTSKVAELGTATYGSCFGDIDNDGDLDLIAINKAANSIFLNNGDGTFTKYAGLELITNPNIFEIGGAMADFDKDGFLDVYPPKGNTVTVDLPNFLYRNNGVASASKNWLEVKLTGTLSNVAAIGARVIVTTTSPARTQIRELSTHTGYGSANSLIAHFGLGIATTANIQIKWPSGIIQTLNGVTSNQLIDISEDNTPPAITLLNPLNGATGVPYNTPLEITFNEKPVAVAGKKISLYLTSNLTTPIQQFDVSTSVIAGNKVSFTPSSALTPISKYSVAIDAGAFADIYGNAISAFPASSWAFRSLDNSAPTISFKSIPTIDEGTTPISFSATVQDNSGSVKSFTMSYRNVENKSFTDVPISGAKDGVQNFPVPTLSEMGINYYFTATDSSNNITRLPTAAGSYFSTRVHYPATNLPTLTLVKGSGRAGDYQIISVPWQIADKDIATNFEELSGGDTKFRFLRYHQLPTPGWDEYPGSLTTFARGDGYFVNTTDVDKITLTEAYSPNENRDSLFTFSLKKGWNEIGNPYTTPIQWADVLTYNNVASGLSQKLLIFSAGYLNAEDPGIINPKGGGFVLADNDINNLKIPFMGQLSGGRLGYHVFSKDISQSSWDVDFTLTQSDVQFKVASIGMATDASNSKDVFDMAVPPRLGADYIEMSVDHPEYFMKQLARDVVQTQAQYAWIFNVQSNVSGYAELRWDNSTFGDNLKELFLLDVNLQRLVNMRESNLYRFYPTESKTLKIYFGEELEKKIKPSMVLLGKAYPNPTNKITQISFTLPDSNSPFQVRIEVFDIFGRRVATLTDRPYEAGFYSVQWDTSTINNSGLYIYRLIVNGETGQQIQSEKIVIEK